MNSLNISLRRAIMFIIFLKFPIYAQIAQNNPGLCGQQDSIVPLPEGVSAVSDRLQGTSELSIKLKDRTRTFEIPGIAEEVEQVCPIPNNRLLIFAAANYLQNINIVNRADGQLIDSFYGSSPSVSPNQHWIIMRKFHPNQMMVPFTEEYVLYDLHKDRKGNRQPGADLQDSDSVGTLVFPVVAGNAPFDNDDVSKNQIHDSRSDSFFWAPDSQAVLFGDFLQGKLSAVLVTVSYKGKTAAYVHQFTTSEIFGGPPPASSTTDFTISHAEVSSPQNGERVIRIRFRPAASAGDDSKELILHSNDFLPAKTEVHIPLKRTPAVHDPS